MIIGRKFHSAGDTIRYEVDYSEWLEEGRTISDVDASYSAALTAVQGNAIPTDVTISNVSVTSSKLFFFLAGGTVKEVFTVEVQVSNTLGEVIIDTIEFTIIAP